MDTVYVLIGKIGNANLSTQAKKRLKALNGLNDKLINLQKALEEAEEKDKGRFQQEVDEAQEYLNNYEEDFRVFLDDEWQDLKAKQEKEAEKKKAKQAEKEAEEAEKARIAEEEAKKSEEEA